MKLVVSPLVLAAALALTACAPARFSYAPVATTSADVAGMAAASYPVPSDAPNGEVHVAVLGVADVRRHPQSPWTEKAIRVSLVVSNRSSETWRVEGGDQHVELASRRVRTTLDAKVDDDGRELLVDVPPHSTRWVELLFLVPEETDSELLGAFDVSWSVRLGPAMRASRVTRFEKLLAPPAHKGVERAPDPYAPLDTMPSSDMPMPGSTPPARKAPPPQ
jgi:hypothetical protein